MKVSNFDTGAGIKIMKFLRNFLLFMTSKKDLLDDVILPCGILYFFDSNTKRLSDFMESFKVYPIPEKIHARFMKLMCLITLLIFICFTGEMKIFLETNSKCDLNFCFSLFQKFLFCVKLIINHWVFLYDKDNFGCSPKAEKLNSICDNAFMFSSLLFCFIPSMVIRFKRHIFVLWEDLAYSVILLFPLVSYLFSSTVENTLFQFPDAKDEDLAHDKICIICRQVMRPHNSKKLPCGHCCHSKCIERWIIDHPYCPICRMNLIENEQ